MNDDGSSPIDDFKKVVVFRPSPTPCQGVIHQGPSTSLIKRVGKLRTLAWSGRPRGLNIAYPPAPTGTSRMLPLARRPSAWEIDGMARPLAKIVAVLTPKRRWAQFSLFTMFVVVTVLCVWLSVVVNRAHRQRDAVAVIKALGGTVEYEEPDETASETFPRPFLRRWLPRDYVDKVREVDLSGTQVTDAGLEHLRGLTGLQVLWLVNTQVTDAGLDHLQGLTGLECLWLNGTQVTDAGLAHLQGLIGLQRLILDDTHITDSGLDHLRGLTGLEMLSITGTHITDAGLAHLQGLVGLQELYLNDVQITGAGLAELQGLTSLFLLKLDNTQVTDAGLAHLQGLTGLKKLSLYGTQVTDAGRAKLRQALPKCHVHGW